MRFTETKLKGAWIIDIEPHEDERGFFARLFDAKEFEARGMNPFNAQSNMAHNEKAGTMRGMHFQLPPATETKLIRCVRGAVYDVVVDFREDSPTYLEHVGVELTADNRRALYIPGMFAHSYQTLEDNSDVIYQVSEYYAPGVESGLRYDDPRLAIEWPLPVSVISEKDRNWPLLEERLGAAR
jgi:dTDP-4-dehydrorhamnose 3,5-epimerase